MAASLQQGGRSLASGVGRRVAYQIRIGGGRNSTLGSRRGVQASACDKNPDEPEHVRASAVPDEVIKPQSDKYWGPNPKTGVFGPADQSGPVGDDDPSSSAIGSGGSVLDQGVWFRPLEDVEKPPPA